MFTDLAFDSPEVNGNGTPKFSGDDYYEGSGRAPALFNMRLAAQQYYGEAMANASSPGIINSVNTRWAPAMDALFTGNALAEGQAKEAMDKINQTWQGLISKGVGMIPFSNVVDNNLVQYIYDQTKSNLLPGTLDHFLSTNNNEGFNANLVEGHTLAERYMRTATYEALSREGIFPGDGTNSPENYCKKLNGEQVFFEDGKILDYSQMTPRQRAGFEEYVDSLDKNGVEGYEVNQGTLSHADAQLNDAADERREAQERVNAYSGTWKGRCQVVEAMSSFWKASRGVR